MKIKDLSLISILAAMAVILMLIEIPLFFAPGFYKMDLSEIPVLIGTFLLGPVSGVVIEFVKILGNFLINGTSTAFVGEIANFFVGIAFCVPAGIIYKKIKNRKGAMLSLIIGTLSMTVVGGFLNAFVLLPVYSIFMNIPIDSFIGMGSAVNPLVSNLPTLILFAVVPFNIIKGVLVSCIVFFIYKPISYKIHERDKRAFKDLENPKEI